MDAEFNCFAFFNAVALLKPPRAFTYFDQLLKRRPKNSFVWLLAMGQLVWWVYNLCWSAGLNYILFLIMQSRNFISHLHLVQIAHDFILLKLELGLSDVACTWFNLFNKENIRLKHYSITYLSITFNCSLMLSTWALLRSCDNLQDSWLIML